MRALWLALAWAIAMPAAWCAVAPLEVGRGGGSYALGPHIEYLEDPTGTLNLAEVRAPEYAGRFQAAPSGGDVNFGYSKSAYWLRFTLAATTDTEPRTGNDGVWYLEIAFPSLDRLQLFAPAADGSLTMQQAGDLQPFAARPYRHRNFVFPLHLPPAGKSTLYVRIQSQGSLTIPATLWSPAALHAHDETSYSLSALYFGMLLGLMSYNLLLFISLRDKVFLAYVLFVASMCIGQASFDGTGNQFLWPEWPAWGNVALPSGMSATGFFGAVFSRIFLDTRRVAPRVDRLILVLAGLFALSALSPLLLPYRFAAISTSLLGIAFASTATAGALYCLKKGQPGARYFLAAWGLLLTGVAVLALRNLGWLPTTLWTRYAMQIGSAVEMLLLSFALADRIQVMRREKESAQSAALEAHLRMLETLRQSETQLEQRVVERTRELADANQRLRAQEALLQRLAHQDPLTGLANRALLEQRLAAALDKARLTRERVAMMVLDLDGFKPVNDAYGHQVGDQLLIAIADRLRNTVRACDTVARMGGDEIMIVIEGLHRDEDAGEIANKIATIVAQPLALDNAVVAVTASIGLAIFPTHGDTTQSLVAAADSAMYAAKRAGGNRYRLQAPVSPQAA